MKSYRKKRDANEPLLIEALKTVQCNVLQINDDGLPGVPDLLVRFEPHSCDCEYCQTGVLRLIEVKNADARGKLSDAQRDFKQEWGDTVGVARTVGEALRMVGR